MLSWAEKKWMWKEASGGSQQQPSGVAGDLSLQEPFGFTNEDMVGGSLEGEKEHQRVLGVQVLRGSHQTEYQVMG